MSECSAFFDEIRGKGPTFTERRKNWNLVDSKFPTLHVMEWDDAVTLSIRVLCSRWVLTICLWIISYILAMVQVMFGGLLTLLIFIPMWIGR